MTDNTHPEALRLADMLTADEWPGHVTLVSYARECVAELRRQHARITELEAQLEAISAEPAGAGYAELPDAKTLGEAVAAWIGVETRGAHNWVDTTVDRLGFAVRSVMGDMLRASHGQAPAWATKPTEQQILEAAFAPAQPAAEASRFGSPELQAMIIARCVEKDQADSVQEDAARLTSEQEYAIRQGHEIAASDGYFDARPQIESKDRRKVFQAGFERGWDAARKQGATEKTQPTDAEILDAADDFRSQYKHGGTTFDEFDALDFARAVLAKWGQPQAGAGEPVAVIEFTDGVKEPRIMSWNALPAGQHRVYTTPQPTQMQAGAVPLTPKQMESGREAIFSTGNPYCPCDSKTFRKVAEWVERHHGIKQGGQHAD